MSQTTKHREADARLARSIEATFDVEELKTLCFKLNINYDTLPAEGLAGKARELVAYCRRRGMVDVLILECYDARPNMFWCDEVWNIPPKTLQRVMPRLTNGGTGRLRGIQLARVEARQDQLEGQFYRLTVMILLLVPGNLMTMLERIARLFQ
jgi:hypothetical protein